MKRKLTTQFLLRLHSNKKCCVTKVANQVAIIRAVRFLSNEDVIKVTYKTSVSTQSLLIHSSLTNPSFFSPGKVVFKCEAAGYNGCLFRNRVIFSKKRIINNYADVGDVIRSDDTNIASHSRR